MSGDWSRLCHHRFIKSIFPCVGRYRQLFAMATSRILIILAAQFTENSNPPSERLRSPSCTGDDASSFSYPHRQSGVTCCDVMSHCNVHCSCSSTANFHKRVRAQSDSRICHLEPPSTPRRRPTAALSCVTLIPSTHPSSCILVPCTSNEKIINRQQQLSFSCALVALAQLLQVRGTLLVAEAKNGTCSRSRSGTVPKVLRLR